MYYLIIFILFFTDAEFEAEENSEIIMEELEYLKANPININKAKEEDLMKIYWLTDEIAKNIIKTRKIKGKFKSLNELLEVEGIDEEIYNLILPYITLEDMMANNFEIKIRSNNEGKFYQRTSIKHKNIYALVLTEKDEKEKNYLAFYSYGFMVENYKVIKKLAIGYYMLDFGESLLFGYPPAISFKTQGKIKNKNNGIELYKIAGENNFLKGIAIENKITKNVNNYLFISSTQLDGKISSDDTIVYYSYESSSIENKDKINEKLLGMRINYKEILGLTGYRNWYYLPELWQTHTLLSANFNTNYFFGEIGFCDKFDKNSYAYIFGMNYKIKKYKFGILYRYYPTKFYGFHSTPWISSSITRAEMSEKGVYLFSSLSISKNDKIFYYFDFYNKLPRTYSSDMTIYYTDYLIELTHKLEKYAKLTSRYFHKQKQEIIKNGVRLQIEVENLPFKLRIRVERFFENNDLSDLLYSDIITKFSNINFNLRIILFTSNLKEFNLYEYESDLPGVMNNYPLTSSGTRIYFLITYKYKDLNLSFKYEINQKIEYEQKYKAQFLFNKKY